MSQAKRFERDLRVIQSSGAAEMIEQLLSPVSATTGKRMGRPRQLRVDVLLTGILRAFRDGHSVRLKDVHRLLTSGLPRSYRNHLGITRPDGKTISCDTLYYLIAKIADRLDAHINHDRGIDQYVAADREAKLQKITNLILAATMPQSQPHASEYAIDATAIDTWARPRKDGRSFDPDAAFGHRTKTHHNRSKKVYGYQAVGFARIDCDGPALIERVVLAPGNSQGVEQALKLIKDWWQERADNGQPAITKVISDRGFSNTVPEDWAIPLHRHRIKQVVDVHPNQHGAKIYRSVAMLDGAPHHLATPEHLHIIERPPALYAGELRRDATPEERAAHDELVEKINCFRAAMREREQYAYRRISGPDIDGKERYEAPCCAGKLRDPACELSMQAPGNLPLITYPDGVTPPPHQRTITLPGNVQAKLRQRLRWGSDEWIEEYSRRTAVEGQFSNWKSKGGEGVERGWIRLVGRIKTTFMIVLATAASNLRQLRQHAKQAGDYTDPKTRPVIENTDHEEIDADGNLAPYDPAAPITTQAPPPPD